MKCAFRELDKGVKESHPSRGAWIEIRPGQVCAGQGCGRTPHGVRGLKSLH